LVASIAPQDARGRYLAVFHTVWVLAAGIAPLMAGFVLDNLDPNWIWIAAGILSVVVAIGYMLLWQRAVHYFLMQPRKN